MIHLFDYANYLGIVKPIVVKINSRSHKHWEGSYLPKYNAKGKLVEHRITIWLDGMDRDLETVLAHELIHAYHEENGILEWHGKRFKKDAKLMTKKFSWLKDVYRKGIDT